MQFISCHDGKLVSAVAAEAATAKQSVRTGFSAIDDLLPGGGFAKGAVHELLHPLRRPPSKFFALLIARASQGAIVWCDPQRTLYPPAVAAMGVDLQRLYLLRPRNATEESWALAECLRCRGVAVTIASVDKLSRLEARRLQLAAEAGGGIGLLLRPLSRHADVYAAASRWLIEPSPGQRTTQRWKIQLLHAHGGRIGTQVLLEHRRETNSVSAVEQLADRARPPQGASGQV